MDSHVMAALELFVFFVLGFEEGISGVEPDLYQKVGDDVVLPCTDPPSDSCSRVMWLYNDILNSSTETKVKNGIVKQGSVNAARLSVDSKCSLIIKKIDPKDAGRYTCRPETGRNKDSLMHLTILTISQSQSADNATKDGNVRLRCSLWAYLLVSCTDKNLVWVNGTGSQLVENVTIQQQDRKLDQCVSTLTVKHPRTKYTCQFLEGRIMKIEAHYSPLSTDGPTQMASFYIIGAVSVAGVLLLVVIAAVLFKYRKRTKQSEDQKNSNSAIKDPNHPIHQNIETPPSLTYASLSLLNPKFPDKVKGQEDLATYSTIKPKMEMEVDINPSSLYCRVSKPK